MISLDLMKSSEVRKAGDRDLIMKKPCCSKDLTWFIILENKRYLLHQKFYPISSEPPEAESYHIVEQSNLQKTKFLGT